MLAGNDERDLSVEVLGTRSAGPFLLAPIGVLSIAHPDGELAPARAAAAAGVPFILSSAASHSIEEVAEAMGDAPRWFQLYWINDRDVAASFVRRAAAAGYGAVVVTLDTPILGWRRPHVNGYLPFLSGEGCAQFFSDRVFCRYLAKPPAEDLLTAAATMLATFPNLGLTWDDLAWLREQVELPLLVKGVVTGEDAMSARQRGVDGVIVSNHRGRQVDGAVASPTPSWRCARRSARATVLVGGVRTGADVLKALALGGRRAARPPVCLRAAAGGQDARRGRDPTATGRDRHHAALLGGRRPRAQPLVRCLSGPGAAPAERAGRAGRGGGAHACRAGPGEVQVRLAYSGVCHSDLHAIETGGWGMPLPMLLGHEGAGVVEELGEGVDGVAPGDRVVLAWRSPCGACPACRRGDPRRCRTPLRARRRIARARDGERVSQMLLLGTFATRTNVHAGAVVKVPPELPLEQACLIGCAVATGVGSVLNTSRPWPGAAVAVIGCGAVGLSVVQGARFARSGSSP
jgi:isopentenyl diphosphate isomerase/L-lactate dehydrogenase-like FMN-dependent dehydrogenase